MKKRGLLLFVATLFCVGLYAQQQAQNSLYYFNPLNFNPAYAGSRDALTIGAVHRIQWTGIDGAPNTTFLTVHAPIKNTHLSIGGDLTYDEIGVITTTSAYLDLSYYVQLNDRGHRLSFGLKGGLSNFDARFEELRGFQDESAQIQEALMSVQNKKKINFGAGLYYYGAHHYIGFSALSLLENSILDDDDYKGNVKDNVQQLKQKRHYYLAAGYVFDINSSLKLKPSGLIKAVAGAPVEFDAEIAALLYDRLWVGLGYRHDESFRGYITANVTRQFRIGYNYDYIFNKLGRYTGGTHEFMLSYDFDYDKLRFKSPRYF